MLRATSPNSQGTAAKIIVGVIVLAFAGFGVDSILLGGGSNAIAEINGEEISPQALQQTLETQKRRLYAMMGDNLDPAMLDDDRLRPQALESLINRTLMMQKAADMGLSISEAEIGRMVANMEQFQVDGQFSPELYRNVLAQAGFTPAFFKASLREDLVLAQLNSGLSASEFATPGEIGATAAVLTEQRDVRYLTISQASFRDALTPTSADIEAWYEGNSERFLTEESVDASFIHLRRSDFSKPVEESVLREAYETEIDGYECKVAQFLFVWMGYSPNVSG